MLKIHPIADDDNVLDQLCSSLGRIEAGLGDMADMLLEATAAPADGAELNRQAAVRSLVARLKRSIATARRNRVNEIAVPIDDVIGIVMALRGGPVRT